MPVTIQFEIHTWLSMNARHRRHSFFPETGRGGGPIMVFITIARNDQLVGEVGSKCNKYKAHDGKV